MGRDDRRVNRLIRQVQGDVNKAAPIVSGMILPNVSGDRSRSIVRDTPARDTAPASKKYVDDNKFTSPLTTKGDVHTYSTADARVAVGANDTVLTAASGETTGLKWAAAAGGGSMVLLFEGNGSTAETTEVTLDTFTAATNDWANKDVIYIECNCDGDNDANGGVISIDINDGTNTHSSDTITTGHKGNVLWWINPTAALRTNFEECQSFMSNINQGDGGSKLYNGPTAMINSWLTAGLVITLRGFADTAGTIHITWRVYKIVGNL